MSLFFSESPTNPYLRCVDVPRIKQLCAAKGAVVVIDSTFATPINQQVGQGRGECALQKQMHAWQWAFGVSCHQAAAPTCHLPVAFPACRPLPWGLTW